MKLGPFNLRTYVIQSSVCVSFPQTHMDAWTRIAILFCQCYWTLLEIYFFKIIYTGVFWICYFRPVCIITDLVRKKTFWTCLNLNWSKSRHYFRDFVWLEKTREKKANYDLCNITIAFNDYLIFFKIYFIKKKIHTGKKNIIIWRLA